MSAPSSAPDPAGPVPLLATRLGLAGLLPFVLGAALVWIVNEEAHPYVVDALAGYAALIASFLGGLHWGLAMRLPEGPLRVARLRWAVLPSLIAWIGLTMPAYAGLVVLGGLLIACYLVDRRSYPALGLAPWLTLRFRLSTVAALSCFLAAAGS